MFREARWRSLVMRIVPYLAFVAMLWLKFRANHTIQVRVVAVLFIVGAFIVNYFCLRLVNERSRHPSSAQMALVARSTKAYVLLLGYMGVTICDGALVVSILRLRQGMNVPGDAIGAAWLGGLIGVLLTWAGSYELRIKEDELEYLSLAIGYRALRLHDIDHAKFRTGWFTYSDRFRPTSRLEIVPTASAKSAPIVVNLKVFRKQDLEQAFDWLGQKLTGGPRVDS